MSDHDHPSPEAPAERLSGEEHTAQVEPDMEKLRAYTQTKLALAEQLRIVREAFRTLGLDSGERQCEELVVKLAEDRFTLAVLGQFKRGKSSLMNAIIGRDLLPTGVLPLTSAITVLKYGPDERLVVRRENSIFPGEQPISALADYITEKGNPSNRKKVKHVFVELPVPFLRSGIEFVDTPGVGSAITANTQTAYGFLPECDAVLFVTGADMPMTSLELAFLQDIREHVDKIFFVVNKIDLVTEDERNEVLEFVTEAIRSQTGLNAVKIFPVSARLGLAARMSGDADLYGQSGLKALEEALASFLSEEKSVVFLGAIARRAGKILRDEMERGAFEEDALQARAIAIRNDKSIACPRDPRDAAASAAQARSELAVLHQGILEGRLAAARETDVPPSMTERSGPAAEADIAASAPEDMEADLRTRGCPVCRRIVIGASEFFAHWQYEIGSREQAQKAFAAEMGFCPLHTWQLLAMCSPYGASVGFARLAEQVARRLREHAADPASGDAVRRLVRDSRDCRVCALLRRSEEDIIRQLAAGIADAAGRSRYAQSQGVCLRHLGMLMEATPESQIREFLLSHAVRRFEEDAEDMRSFAMKREAIRRALENRNEEDAYRRAVIRFAGSRNVCAPWAGDGEI